MLPYVLASTEERVRWLMRTYYEAREGYATESTGEGVRMMPSDFGRYSYPELERCLIDMRDNGGRQLWYHATRRYRDARRVVLDVPVRRTRLGAVPRLPGNCELAGGAVLIGAKWARVLVRRWPEDVRADLAEAGVQRLVELMYDGARERIMLPPAVAEVAFGAG